MDLQVHSLAEMFKVICSNVAIMQSVNYCNVEWQRCCSWTITWQNISGLIEYIYYQHKLVVDTPMILRSARSVVQVLFTSTCVHILMANDEACRQSY